MVDVRRRVARSTLALALVACSPSTPMDARPPRPVADGRMGVHGMIVFGSSKIYLSHIPTFHAPHDLQLVLTAEAARGWTSRPAFSTELFTFEPVRFSLDALVDARLPDIRGTLFQGSFEGDGHPILQDVDLRPREIVYRSAPLSAPTPPMPELDYLLFGDGAEAYLLHTITHPPDFDQIVAIRVTDPSVWPAGTHVRIAGRPNAAESRLSVSEQEIDASIPPLGRHIRFTVTHEVSCLLGPGFDASC